MHTRFPKIIVIEGSDCVGKETQSSMLVKTLERTFEQKVATFSLPNYSSATGRAIRKLLQNGYAEKFQTAFQLLQFLDKLNFQRTLSRLDCDFVVLDRWSLSSLIYGLATKVNPTVCAQLFAWLKQPDLTIVLDGAGFKRNSLDSYEKNKELQDAVKSAYKFWASSRENDNSVALINADQSEFLVHSEILTAVMDRFQYLNPIENFSETDDEI